jgi:hypothetical protein
MRCVFCQRTNELHKCAFCEQTICFYCSRQYDPEEGTRECNEELRTCGFDERTSWALALVDLGYVVDIDPEEMWCGA